MCPTRRGRMATVSPWRPSLAGTTACLREITPTLGLMPGSGEVCQGNTVSYRYTYAYVSVGFVLTCCRRSRYDSNAGQARSGRIVMVMRQRPSGRGSLAEAAKNEFRRLSSLESKAANIPAR
jgi:hypothetical protein